MIVMCALSVNMPIGLNSIPFFFIIFFTSVPYGGWLPLCHLFEARVSSVIADRRIPVKKYKLSI